MFKKIFKFKNEVTEGWTDDGLNAYNGLIVALGSAIACFAGLVTVERHRFFLY